MMELWGSGFNALGQVQSSPNNDALDDIRVFTKLASGQTIEMLYAGWAQTVIRADGLLHVLGLPLLRAAAGSDLDETDQNLDTWLNKDPHFDLVSSAGTESDGLRALTATTTSKSRLLIVSTPTKSRLIPASSSHPSVESSSSSSLYEWISTFASENQYDHIVAIATTSSGVTAAVVSTSESSNLAPRSKTGDEQWTKIVEFSSFQEFLEYLRDHLSSARSGSSKTRSEELKEQPFRTFFVRGKAKRLLANALSFVLLTEEGSVWTWACEMRFAHALGRDRGSGTSILTSPGIVEELVGLKVIHIAAGGWMAGAISDGGDAWVWGCDAPGEQNNFNATRSAGLLSSLREINKTEEDDGDLLIKLNIPVLQKSRRSRCHPESSTAEKEEEGAVPEIQDLAIGEAHILILDSEGVGWCCGRNANGQLGIDSLTSPDESARGEETFAERARDRNQVHQPYYPWTDIDIPGCKYQDGGKITRVFCGDFTSFLLASNPKS